MGYALFLLMLVGIGVFVVGLRWQRKLNRYEFENRTEGGAVQFADFDASNMHEGNKRLAKLLINIGLIPAIAGVLFLLYGILVVVGWVVDSFS